jgi:hypothetical protein
MGGIYEIAEEMRSGTLIYIASFIKIGSAIQRLIGGIHIHTHTHRHTAR